MDDEFGGVRSENIIQQEKESGAYFNSQHKIRIKCWKHAHTFFFFFQILNFPVQKSISRKTDMMSAQQQQESGPFFLVDKPPQPTCKWSN